MSHLPSVISTSINQVINQSVFICKGLNHIQSHLEALCKIKYSEKIHSIIYFYFLIVNFNRHAGNSAAGGDAATKRSTPALTLC